MLRKICGPIQENNVWRPRNNREQSELFRCETVVGTINSFNHSDFDGHDMSCEWMMIERLRG